MQKKLIVRIANGFGNQMFNYATAFAFAKKLGYQLFIDDESSSFADQIKSEKKIYLHWYPKYELDIFQISSPIAKNSYKFNTRLKKIYRKLLIFFDLFKKKKSFLIEKKNKYKKTNSSIPYLNKKYSNILYLEGYFESENYFSKFKNELLNEFKFKKIPPVNAKYQDQITNSNSVSIAVRRDRFSERIIDQANKTKINKSQLFENNTFDYIFNAVNFFKRKMPDCKFFIFSDNFDNLEKIFNKNEFTFIEKHINSKSLEDFFLMRLCKHFIVGPTSFHWWAAWLSQNNKTICTYPQNINPSNNADFWPKSWIKV